MLMSRLVTIVLVVKTPTQGRQQIIITKKCNTELRKTYLEKMSPLAVSCANLLSLLLSEIQFQKREEYPKVQVDNLTRERPLTLDKISHSLRITTLS